jgi:hypothetical protein
MHQQGVKVTTATLKRSKCGQFELHAKALRGHFTMAAPLQPSSTKDIAGARAELSPFRCLLARIVASITSLVGIS